MNRRDFLRVSAAAALAPSAAPGRAAEAPAGDVMTVAGPVPGDQVGVTLPHEHVMVDFIGADRVSRDRYDAGEVYRTVLRHLTRAKEAGCRTLVECTPTYLGRDPALLKRLAAASGLRIITNTGYYGAREGKFLPEHAKRETADQLAARWIAEWEQGIEETGVRPGFIKIGVDGGPLTPVNAKLVRSASRAHLETGLTIACHTGDGAAALEQLAILEKEGVDPAAWIWVHTQNEPNQELHRRAASQGGWVELDGIRPGTIDRHVKMVERLRKADLLGRVLVSHDAGWYSVGEPDGGAFRPYTTVFEQFLPALKEAGFGDEETHRLTVANPAEAFAIRVRRR